MTDIQDYRDIMDALGINPNELGCVMLEFESLGECPLPPDWLYISDDPEKWWVKGYLGDKPHVTLKYGLTVQASEWEAFIMQLLGDWVPEPALPMGVMKMPGHSGDPYICLALGLNLSQNLEEAYRRLSYLPHIDTFTPYLPHVTLAYVKPDWAEECLNILTEWIDGRQLVPTFIDLGSDKS